MTFKTTEKGQALIVIALAAVMLFAFASLAIDGSMAFSDKRHAQNAADTSVLAAALAKTRTQDWDAAARARATSNGYTDDGTTIVKVYLCGDVNTTCGGLPAGATLDDYVQVKITSHVKTSFARVIGRSEIINRVEAIAHAVPGYRNSAFGGQALVALNKDNCSAFAYGGNGTINVTGSAIFVNSRCPSAALKSTSDKASLNVPCYNVVGRVDSDTITSTGPCTSIDQTPTLFMSNPLASFPAPKIDCDSYPLGEINTTGSTTTITPGRYNYDNSGNSFPATGWKPDLVMQPGIYCIDVNGHDFTMSGTGSTLIGSGVLIYMETGGVAWTTGNIHLSAIQGVNPDYDGLLLYLPPANTSIVSITGSGDSTFVGTILAPGSLVKIAGGSGTGTAGILENQIISDTMALTGGAELTINFNARLQWQPPIPPEIQMTQ